MSQIKEALLQYTPNELITNAFSQLKITAETMHDIIAKLESKYRESRLLDTLY